MTAFIVPTDTEGVTITSNYDKMGIRGSDTAEIVLGKFPGTERKYFSGRNIKDLNNFYTPDGGRISIGALGLGIAQASLEKALEYAKERKQFGQSISKFQAIQFKLADMAMETELARNMVYKQHG